MGGDLLWHNTVWFSAAEDAWRTGRIGYDFDPMFAQLRLVQRLEGWSHSRDPGECRGKLVRSALCEALFNVGW